MSMKRVCQTLGLIAVMFVVAMMKPAAQGSG
jgi:hypothetical protein